MAVINTFSAGMPSNIGTWNLRTDFPAFRITAHQLVGGAVEVYFSTTAGRINWDFWTFMNPATRFPKWFLDASTYLSHPKSQCSVDITYPSASVMIINFGTPGALLPPPDIEIGGLDVVVTASGTPWSTATMMVVSFRKYGSVGWLTIPEISKMGDTTTNTISFDFPGFEWPVGFKPAKGQAFPFKGVYQDVLWEVNKYNYAPTPLPPSQPIYEDVYISLENLNPPSEYNVIRITAPCFFNGSGVGAAPWPTTWPVSWPSQTFCYNIAPSV